MNTIAIRRQAAEGLLGAVVWTVADAGYCRCPGIDLHTSRNARRDCRVMLNGAPTIHCVHTSCAGVIAEANRKLRSAIGRAELTGALPGGERWRPTAADIERKLAEDRRRRLERRSVAAAKRIIAENRVEAAEFFESSPVPLLGDPREDWRLLLGLFPPGAVVWIGQTKDSCDDEADEGRKAYCRTHFRTVAEWLKEAGAPGQFTCPSVFQAGVHSRSNANVTARPFLVVESDTLDREAMTAVFTWMRRFLRLRAIVDTAGKSLHGWFNYPAAEQLEELRVILPALGCDEALFKASQPCRLPGAPRERNLQRLLWLDREERA